MLPVDVSALGISATTVGADLVVHNGKIWTVDATYPQAQAIAIVGDRIACVGTNEEIRQWVGQKTLTLDAEGKTVLPGFIDSHVHFSAGGMEVNSVQLRDAANPQEFVRRVSESVKKLPKGEWILGGQWDHELWPGAPYPIRGWIDKYTADNPVLVSRRDGHMTLANSLALRLGGITRDTACPVGGEIVKDASGEPTGLLKDAAIELVMRVIPSCTAEQLTSGILAAFFQARRFGVTSIHDNSSADDMRVYQKLLNCGDLTARIYCMLPIEQWESITYGDIRVGFDKTWIRLGALKGFVDGSLGSTTALFFEPYDDAPETSGLAGQFVVPENRMLEMALGSDRAGLQLCIHAIGDRANCMALDIYDEVVGKSGGTAKERRFRIEHAQTVHPADFSRFARLGVIASVQPYHLVDDGCWTEKRIGRQRCRTTYAFRTFLNNGVRLAFGSDWTVAPLNPMQGVYAALTRATSDNKNPDGWFPEQKISLVEAIEAYTMGGAYAEFSENEKDSVTPGKLADIVVLDRDMFAASPKEIKDVKVQTTIAGGKVVYEAASD